MLHLLFKKSIAGRMLYLILIQVKGGKAIPYIDSESVPCSDVAFMNSSPIMLYILFKERNPDSQMVY